jgi:outer membrane immunogenic protein
MRQCGASATTALRGSLFATTLATAAFASAAFATKTLAADMPLKAPPRVAAPVNWSGIYIGGHVGYGWADKDFSLPDIAGEKFGDCYGKDQFCYDFTKLGGPVLSQNLKGFLGGVQGGFNVQSGAFVLGIEGQFSWTGMKEDSQAKLGEFRFFDCWTHITKEIDLKARAEVNWVATIAGRIGYAFDRALIYAKGGVAFADQDYSWVVNKGDRELATAKFSETRTGWMVGGGLEWALWQNWSAKIEYNFMDFGSDTLNAVANVCHHGECSKTNVRVDIDEQMHVVKVGVNYRFGAPAIVRAAY